MKKTILYILLLSTIVVICQINRLSGTQPESFPKIAEPLMPFERQVLEPLMPTERQVLEPFMPFHGHWSRDSELFLVI